MSQTPRSGILQQLASELPIKRRLPFCYTADYNSTIAAAADADSFIKVHSDSDFECTKILWGAFDNASPTSDQLIRARIKLQIQDTGSNSFWFSSFIYAGHVAGEAFVTFGPVFSVPRMLKAGCQVKTTLRNSTPSTTLTGCKVHLYGNKLFR